MNPLETLSEIIRKRRAIFPVQYSDDPVSPRFIEQLLELANWAPTHRRTEPWRYIVVSGDARKKLGQFMADKYKAKSTKENFNQAKFDKTKKKFEQSQYVILICMQRDEKQRLPEWEEVASVAMGVQNMWLACTAAGVGAYWSSPGTIADMGEYVDLTPGERCLGLFYIGGYSGATMPGVRGDYRDKVRYISE